MQEEIEGVRSPLIVLALWVPMYPGDARDRWRAELLPDIRARHFWDGGLAVARWFAANLPPAGFVGEAAWDCFYVYAPGARWAAAPLASGFPVVPARVALARGLRALG